MDNVKKKMMGLITGFFLGLSEADKVILKSQLNNVDELQAGHHQTNIKSPFLNGINQGKITEEQRQHFYKVLNLAEQKWRKSKGFDDPDKMQILMEKRGLSGVLETISCEPIDLGLRGGFYYPVRSNGDNFEVEKVADNMLIYDNEIKFGCLMHNNRRVFENIRGEGNVLTELQNTTQIEWDKKEFDNVEVKYVYNTYGYNVSYKNTIKENDYYFQIVFNKNNVL
jgi:hypothetical protein